MRCAVCKVPGTGVLDTRRTTDGIRRRRECSHCGARFGTVELPSDTPRLSLPLGLRIGPPGNRGRRDVFGPAGTVSMAGRPAEFVQVMAEAWPRIVPEAEAKRRVWGRSATRGIVRKIADDANRGLAGTGVRIACARRIGWVLCLEVDLVK